MKTMTLKVEKRDKKMEAESADESSSSSGDTDISSEPNVNRILNL